MTTLAYFPNSSALNSKEPLQALIDGAKAHGIKCIQDNWDADWAVIWSVLWNGRMQPNRSIYEHFKSQNKPVIVIDVGALYRGNTWKVAIDNITADGYYGHKQNLDWDRPRKLQLSLADQLHSDGSILIAAQHRNSLQVSVLSSLEDWILDITQQLKTHTDRPIIVRPHPRCRLDLQKLGDVQIQQPHKIQKTYDEFDMRFDYHAVVNYNSGPGIQAAISGCPVLVERSSLAHPVGCRIESIDAPPKIDRDTWFTEICHTEYTVEELRKGIWVKRLSEKL